MSPMSAMRLSKTRPVGFYRRLTTAKSQVSRGLAKLRESLGGEHLNLTGRPMEEWTNAVA
ncbi:hypothetical protein Micau_2564 [Micromonospora aurantiaca ATCC 27029]|nr:hypothetical protein Micau_2564 [Micromonospora aurantiaca ATCC 27029]